MEEVYHVVCMPIGASEWDDNVEAVCSECGTAVMHRPSIPTPNIIVCVPCAFVAMEAAEQVGDVVEVVSTPEQHAEMDRLHGPGSVERGIAMIHNLRREYKGKLS